MRKQITAFYVETLILAAAFVAVLLALSQVFGLAHSESERAGRLTEAVQLAERAAEAVAASDSLEDVQALLAPDGEAVLKDGALELDSGALCLSVSWEPDGPRLVRSRIAVDWNGAEIYALETARGRETS